VRHMTSDRSDVVAVRLTSQIDDLSRSLSRAGVALGQRVRLLELAAVAAMQAVTLETSKTPEPATAPAPVTPLSAAPSLRAAVAA
jgi:hypothetical protein